MGINLRVGVGVTSLRRQVEQAGRKFDSRGRASQAQKLADAIGLLSAMGIISPAETLAARDRLGAHVDTVTHVVLK